MRKIIILAILFLALASASWAGHQQFGLGLGLSLGPGKNPTDPYWPVPGVTKPDHLYLFAQTQDYSDHGSVGGLNLTAQGSGNSFVAGGLSLNGSGYAQASAASPDVNNLGATFSIIVYEVYIHSTYASPIAVGPLNGAITCWDMTTYAEQVAMEIINGSDQYVQSTSTPLTDSVLNKIIYTQSGGVGTLYINGTATTDTFASMLTPQSNNTYYLSIGADGTGGYKCYNGTIIRLAAVTKGHAYTQQEVTAINAAPF